jgi:ribonucleotide reductase beta subunit family protein with ferritin-like domain
MAAVASHDASHDKGEVLLQDNPNQFVFFPIQHESIWAMYKKACTSLWFAEEVDLSKDVDTWEKLSDQERYFIKMVLAFFAGSDGIVNYNLAARFLNEVQLPEAKAFYSFQIAMEAVHSEMYALMLNTYVKDTQERTQLFSAVHSIPCIKKKADWALRWIEDKEVSFATRCLAFVIVEGLMFSSSFASIYWLKEKNVMPGLCLSNEFISRDEGMHAEFNVLLYNMLKERLSADQVNAMMRDAVDIEIEFITESIPCALLGMNNDLMTEYIKYVADRLLTQLGYEKIYQATNPFPFMERICLENKSNFFEHTRIADYSKAMVGQSVVDLMKFSTDEDF